MDYTSKLHMSPDNASLVLGIDYRAIRSLFETFNKCFVPLSTEGRSRSPHTALAGVFLAIA